MLSQLKAANPEAYRILRYKWASMKTRCTNPNCSNYANYGGRGIKICDEWQKFSAFSEWSLNNGFEPGLSLDRIDPNKGYNPENCRYITMEEQQRNRRDNRCFIDPFDGEKLCLAAIAKKYNIPEETFRKRIDKYNMSLEKALANPCRETSRWTIVNDPFDNERLCLAALARKYNIHTETLRTRLRNGWSLDKAIKEPVKKVAHKNATI